MACGLRRCSTPTSPSASFPPASLVAPRTLPLAPRRTGVSRHLSPPSARAPGHCRGGGEPPDAVAGAFQASPPTWSLAAATNLTVFVAGSLLLSGLSAWLRGRLRPRHLTWRAFGPWATSLSPPTSSCSHQVKDKTKEAGWPKKGGRRGPGSVIGSSAAGCVCALLSVYNGWWSIRELWTLGFVASFCTKLSDTVSSEIGRHMEEQRRSLYLVTTFKVVPRGTEGAASVEGTLLNCSINVNLPQGVVCALHPRLQILAEFDWLTLQDKEGFEWLNNDVVNVLNISAGAVLSALMQQLLVSWRS
ncbi:hypothetical protein ZWY2020_010355 [Hordeum vulgare]|nr:hypothetical protein ZWY2020_010355 [Hordeum vulgare]